MGNCGYCTIFPEGKCVRDGCETCCECERPIVIKHDEDLEATVTSLVYQDGLGSILALPGIWDIVMEAYRVRATAMLRNDNKE